MTPPNRFRFRAWDKKESEMCAVSGLSDDANGRKLELYRHRNSYYTDDYQGDQYVLMQSTGLLDRNQMEIWEGDIIKMLLDGSPYTMVVAWESRAEMQGFDFGEHHSPEIVGNIYENPELLK